MNAETEKLPALLRAQAEKCRNRNTAPGTWEANGFDLSANMLEQALARDRAAQPEYDRELIAEMLHSAYGPLLNTYASTAIIGQIEALRAADNRSVEGAGTVSINDCHRHECTRVRAEMQAEIDRMRAAQGEAVGEVTGVAEHSHAALIYKPGLPVGTKLYLSPPVAGDAEMIPGECSWQCMSTMSCDNSCEPRPPAGDAHARVSDAMVKRALIAFNESRNYDGNVVGVAMHAALTAALTPQPSGEGEG